MNELLTAVTVIGWTAFSLVLLCEARTSWILAWRWWRQRDE